MNHETAALYINYISVRNVQNTDSFEFIFELSEVNDLYLKR